MKAKKLLALVLALAITVPLVACGQSSSTSSTAASGGTSAAESKTGNSKAITIKLGWAETADRNGHSLSEAAYTFKEQLEKLSGGSIKVSLYPAAQLGDATSMLTQVKAGTLECCMSVSNGQFATSYYPDLGFLDIPYLFESADEAYQLLNPDGAFFKKLQSNISKSTGIRPMVFFDEGLRHITNNKRPIKKPSDLTGLKIRTMNVTAHMKMFEAMGASPTNVSWNELYTALQTGVVDGEENPIYNIVYLSAWEVQKYVTLDGHICLCSMFLMNDNFYNSLSDDQKAAVDKASKAALKAQYSKFQKSESDNLQALKKHGMQVTELNSNQIDAFRQACQPQVIAYLRTAMKTPSLIDEVVKQVKANRK
jgi:C4-dicarboxylate-binding protein DctP